MMNAPLDIRKHLPGIGLIPPSVQVLSRDTKLDDEITRQVLRLNFAPLLPPETEKGGLVVAHNNVSLGPPYEVTTFSPFFTFRRIV
jgi:hypothetical protein